MAKEYKTPAKKRKQTSGWKARNKDHVSDYNASYFQENKSKIYKRRKELKREREETI